ncbi:single-stranded-DNA-specific exonuclease RecJ [Laspinema olomoucense]|uniref:Single-stranded-DNA-specific exonuclease RecJ n=1 Tax=Laspinema olomoucense D3b TaxID=2953688 RepID=A0ABT2N4N6_9CYAN|nr:single-stranded-DNA-specific exonuclease RecJ [Laspinema sp. D3b]MCT7976844.1 single-stranded-DNA-specific exonuclease RecJ [Laspinema sp. D3b]
MNEQTVTWHLQQPVLPPEWFLEQVRQYLDSNSSGLSGQYAAVLLWQRGIQDREGLARFLNPQGYQPASPFDFGQEMSACVDRLQLARKQEEKVAIWGDFDADGITSTSVLWDGLGQFFTPTDQLTYFIPNRLTQSHGLNRAGIDDLAASGTTLIVTCDTGSTNLDEIEYAHQLGIDIIVTDHHTLPPNRPGVVAIINPRSLPATHPLAHLSGVAVAYKVVEAMYSTLPEIPQEPLEALLDLVAIGLIADLVQLSGDCRYLAQMGLKRLHQEWQKSPSERRRPGVGELLDLCKRSGDRPTDVSFGIGPRINAVSRIYGDASFCVELLTTRDRRRAQKLAQDTEIANSRRQAIQKDVDKQVQQKLDRLDLSTTGVIVLQDPQWPAGVLGLVAGKVAQEYARPTILLSTDSGNSEAENPDKIPLFTDSADATSLTLARGSARSVKNIDLYELVKEQEHLLHRFGGHPFAAGLSLPAQNIPLFTEAINRLLKEKLGAGVGLGMPVIHADLRCTVAELGQNLFRELKILEPCGMGNSVPLLLIENCQFKNIWNEKKDKKGRKIEYIKTTFQIWDESTETGFPGLWWGHYKEELPNVPCDAVVELDYNSYKDRYEVRLIAVRPRKAGTVVTSPEGGLPILDFRRNLLIQKGEEEKTELGNSDGLNFDRTTSIVLETCPSSWEELHQWLDLAIQTQKTLAIAYPPPKPVSPLQVWQQLVGLAKYLSRTGQRATREQLCSKLSISDRTLEIGLQALIAVGFQVETVGDSLQVIPGSLTNPLGTGDRFCAAVEEEQFRRKYFYEVSLSTVQAIARSKGEGGDRGDRGDGGDTGDGEDGGDGGGNDSKSLLQTSPS